MEGNRKCQPRNLAVCWHAGLEWSGEWEEPSGLTWTRLCSLFQPRGPVLLTLAARGFDCVRF